MTSCLVSKPEPSGTDIWLIPSLDQFLGLVMFFLLHDSPSRGPKCWHTACFYVFRVWTINKILQFMSFWFVVSLIMFQLIHQQILPLCSANVNKIFFSSWSFSAITCGHPGNPTYGMTQGTQFNLNDNVRFICNTGYVLHGAAKSTCQANGQWNNALPRCKSKYKWVSTLNFHKSSCSCPQATSDSE